MRLILLFAVSAVSALAQQVEQTPFTPVTYMTGNLRIAAYIYKPDGNGPFPLVIYNHGSRIGQERSPAPFGYVGGLLIERGFAVLVPERRGYGGSDGTSYSEEVGDDSGAVFLRRLEAETDDVLAALSYLKTQPWVDQNRLGIMGWSLGGIISMFAAARSDRFGAVVDQAGGALTWPHSGALQKALKDAAQKVTAPVLFMAAKNDRTTDSVTTLAKILNEKRAPNQLIIYDPFTPARNAGGVAPGHLIFSVQGYKLWQDDVGSFFTKYLKSRWLSWSATIIRHMRRVIRYSYAALGLIAALLTPGLKGADAIELKTTATDVLRKRLEAGEVALKDRQATIAGLFAEVGCTVTEQPVTRRFANVICTLPGETPAMIIVGGHYDYVDVGRGLVDDWSGTALLVSLYETLRTKPRKHTYKFIAFAAEERGLVGSAHYVKEMTPEERESTRAFVNLECLGLSPPKVWAHRSSPNLVSLLANIANSIHVPLQGVGVDRVGDDDTHPFLSKKIPVISIHSLTQETLPVLHSRRDNLDAIHMDDYASAYKLAAFYLAYLDSKLD